MTRYFIELLDAFTTVGAQHEYFVYLLENDRVLASRLPAHPTIHLRLLSSHPKRWHRTVQVDLPCALAKDGVDLHHAITPLLPLSTCRPTVVTVHDAIPLLDPKRTLPPSERRTAALWLQLAVQLADHLIVPSRSTYRDLTQSLHVPGRKITVIHHGHPPIFKPTPRAQATSWVKRKFHIRTPFLLSVGTLIPRKNYPLLASAFGILQYLLKEPLTLVIAGKTWWGGTSVRNALKQHPDIRYLGVVSDEDLRALYVASECLVMPSRYEGFGLPALEAMACGTPVVAYKQSSLPEVLGQAGLLVEKGSANALARALRDLLKNTALSNRLRSAGLRRAQRFRWEDTAQKTLRLYHRLMESNIPYR